MENIAPGSGVYAEATQGDPDLLFERTTSTKARMSNGRLCVTGRLADEALGVRGFSRIHDMSLEITCETETMTIVEATADMTNYPHAQCPLMAASAQSLVGLNVTNGYLSAVRARMGGVRGCNHLYALAQQVGTVAALSFAGRHTHDRPQLANLEPVDFFKTIVDDAPQVLNSCHVWREDGEIATYLRDYAPTAEPTEQPPRHEQ